MFSKSELKIPCLVCEDLKPYNQELIAGVNILSGSASDSSYTCLIRNSFDTCEMNARIKKDLIEQVKDLFFDAEIKVLKCIVEAPDVFPREKIANLFIERIKELKSEQSPSEGVAQEPFLYRGLSV